MKTFQTMFLHGMLMVDRHRISDAGLPKSQFKTPLVDMYYYETGMSTELGRRVALETGSVSPVVITKAIDEKLGNYYRFLGIDYIDPEFLQAEHPSPILPIYENLAHFETPDRPLDYGDFPPLSAHTGAIRALLGQASATGFFTSRSRKPARCVISECVPGGTSTASLTLSALYGKYVETPSSSKSQEIAARKRSLIKSTLASRDFSNLRMSEIGLCVDPQNFRYTSDQFQLQLMTLLYSGTIHRMFANNVEYILAGGSQMIAVVAMLKAILGDGAEYQYFTQKFKIVTTSWVYRSITSNPVFAEILDDLRIELTHPHFEFDEEIATPALLKYNQGFTGEGCGMGAALYQAKAAGLSNRDITQVVVSHMERQKRSLSNYV